MLKLKYSYTAPKQNAKFIQLNFLVINLLWVYLLKLHSYRSKLKKTKKLKTLLQSPFHYKVAKKNIVNSNYSWSLTIGFKVQDKINTDLVVFKYWYYMSINTVNNSLNKIQIICNNTKC